jgi:hypothetical protein
MAKDIEAKVDALAEVVADLATQKASATIDTPQKKVVPPLVTVKSGGKEYQFKVHSFSPDGETVVHVTDLIKDQKRLDETIKTYPGLVEEK